MALERVPADIRRDGGVARMVRLSTYLLRAATSSLHRAQDLTLALFSSAVRATPR